MRSLEQQPIDVRIDVEGNRLVGRDAFTDGSVSCLKQNLGEYPTPEHAEIMREIISNPRLTLLIASGQITDEKLNWMATELKRRRATGLVSTMPGVTISAG